MKGKLKVYFANHQPRTWVYRVYSLFFIEKKQLQTSLLSKQNQKRDNFPSTVFESNEHGLSFPVFVGLIQRGLANILIRTSRLCRNGRFSQIKCFDRLQSYMTVNLLRWMYVTFSWKKQTDFKADSLMFLDLPSRMKLLYSIPEQYCIKQRELSCPRFQF